MENDKGTTSDPILPASVADKVYGALAVVQLACLAGTTIRREVLCRIMEEQMAQLEPYRKG